MGWCRLGQRSEPCQGGFHELLLMVCLTETMIPTGDDQLLFRITSPFENGIGMGRRYDLVAVPVNDQDVGNGSDGFAEVELKRIFIEQGLHHRFVRFGRGQNGPAVHRGCQGDQPLGGECAGGGQTGCPAEAAAEQSQSGAQVESSAQKGHGIHQVVAAPRQGGDLRKAARTASAAPMVEPEIGQAHPAAPAGQFALFGRGTAAVEAVGSDHQMGTRLVGQVQGALEAQAVRPERQRGFLSGAGVCRLM